MTDRMTTRHRALASVALAPSGADLFQPDGTMWMHAAALGSYHYGDDQFTLDRATVENFVRVFTSGYPSKAPLDYEHGLTSDDPAVRAARAAGKVPRAGDILELRGVFSAEDLAALPGAAEKAQRAGREPGDERNFGLWARVRPTLTARQMIERGEIVEASITFVDDYRHAVTGEPQGPAILAIALTNMPFIEGMVPVAASRDGGTGPIPAERNTMATKFWTTLSALARKAVGTEEDALPVIEAAIAESQQKDEQIRTLSARAALGEALAAELGEADGAKAITKVRTLSQQVTQLAADLSAAKTQLHKQTIDGVLDAHRDRVLPAQRPYWSKQLAKDLDEGQQPGETETEKTIAALPKHSVTDPAAAPDAGGAGAGGSPEGGAAPASPDDRDQKVANVTEAHLKTDEFKELARTKGRHFAYLAALERAEREVPRARAAAATA